ncbi:MAG: hypothetical protein AAB597_01525 [Patescibacteria group bacterium]
MKSLNIPGHDPITYRREILQLTRGIYENTESRLDLGVEHFADIGRFLGAFWMFNYEGRPTAPHVELTAGGHSDGFINTLLILSYPSLNDILAEVLAGKIKDASPPGLIVDWIVGSDHAGATFSQNVARHLRCRHDFTEKKVILQEGQKVGEIQEWKRQTIGQSEVVLQVEELVTTTATLARVRDGIRRGNPNPVCFAPFSATLVHRSDSYDFDGGGIVFGYHFDIKTWQPSECPLCKQGSKAVRPKQMWAELVGSA